MKSIYRGNTKTYKLKFQSGPVGARVPIDLTGMKVLFTLKSDINDLYEDAVIKKIITVHTDAVNGLSEVVLLRADTTIPVGSYFAFFTLVDGFDEPITYKKEELTILASEL